MILFIGILFFLNKFIENKVSQNVQLKTDLENIKNSDLLSLKNIIRELDDNSSAINDLFIPKDTVFSFINEIENLAKRNNLLVGIQGIEVVDVGPDGVEGEDIPEEERLYGKINLVIRTEGDWTNVTRYLLILENYPKEIS
jgi:hypothetical protein